MHAGLLYVRYGAYRLCLAEICNLVVIPDLPAPLHDAVSAALLALLALALGLVEMRLRQSDARLLGNMGDALILHAGDREKWIAGWTSGGHLFRGVS